jgi:hypothetical protein
MAEVAYKKEFETIFEEEIAHPLGMKNSHFIPINLDGGHAPMLGGGLQTTLDDYIHFLKMIYHDGIYEGKQILQKETVSEKNIHYQKKNYIKCKLILNCRERGMENSCMNILKKISRKTILKRWNCIQYLMQLSSTKV